WFRSNAAFLAYEAYFNHCTAGVGSNSFRPATQGCPRNLQAGTIYQLLFRDPEVLAWPDPRNF
ncbi:MAG TPA: hypothetical protein VJR89_40390, partial [Polyangiales bacterium]|nr:hypothetical protein [Polyangiales bacterium]